MSTAPPNTSEALVMSPALSATSYDMVSDLSRSPSIVSQKRLTDDNSDDEIIWSVAGSSESTESDGTDASTPSEDGDYVLLPTPVAQTKGKRTRAKKADRAHTSTGGAESLAMGMQALKLSDETCKEPAGNNEPAVGQAVIKKQRRRKAKKQKDEASTKTPVPPVNASLPPHDGSGAQTSAVLPITGLGDRVIVDDFSDTHSVASFNGGTALSSPSLYEEAATYISSFLSNPEAKYDSVCRLTLLQSLIIELGLLSTPSLPDTLKSAKAFLKANAFLNIREYLSARQEGPEAVQRAMYPSRSALIKDIKRKRNYTSLKWVKKHGLQVLLVGVIYH